MTINCNKITEDYDMNVDKINRYYNLFMVNPNQNLTIFLNTNAQDGETYDFIIKNTSYDVVIDDGTNKKLLLPNSNYKFLFCDGEWVGYVISLNFI